MFSKKHVDTSDLHDGRVFSMEKTGRCHHAKIFLHRMAHEKPGSIRTSNKNLRHSGSFQKKKLQITDELTTNFFNFSEQKSSQSILSAF